MIPFYESVDLNKMLDNAIKSYCKHGTPAANQVTLTHDQLFQSYPAVKTHFTENDIKAVR